MAPATPGMINSPEQMLLQQANVLPHMAKGGQPEMSVQDMLAYLVNAGVLPQHYAPGGLVKNIAMQSAITAPMMTEELSDIGQDIKNEKYLPAAAKSAGVGYSAFAPLNPLTGGISLATYSPELGDSTIAGFKAQEAARKQAQQEALLAQRQAELRAQRAAEMKAARIAHHGRSPLSIDETAFFKK